MNNRVIIRALILLTVGLVMASHAHADRDYRHHRDYDDDYGYHSRYVVEDDDRYRDYGRVIEARPIYERVAIDVPRDSCGVRTVASRNGDSFAGTVMGGLVGAAIGHELGNGRGDVTAVGGLIGASIGNEASRDGHSVSYRDETVCNRYYHTEYEQRLVGYDVAYDYYGRIYRTRTHHHPGDRILVDVSLRSYR